jgi:DNA-binding NtrC family response regulator
MRDCQWNKTRAAVKLGISPKTLLAKLRAAGLDE